MVERRHICPLAQLFLLSRHSTVWWACDTRTMHLTGERRVQIQLVGGLGNQLFGYFAGLALSRITGRPLYLDTSWVRHGMTDHGMEILQIDLPGQWMPDQRPFTRALRPGTLSGRLGQKIAATIGKTRWLKSTYTWRPGDSLEDVVALNPRYLRGYFHHLSFPGYVFAQQPTTSLSIRSPSREFLYYQKILKSVEVTAIHVRLGDYRSLGPGIRLTSAYFRSAITRVRDELPQHSILLFSDDPDEALSMLPELSQRDSKTRVLPKHIRPAEALILMRSAHAHILSNSTFAWWGAFGTNSKCVIVPAPWTSNGTSPGFLPSNWIPINASFD